jgi:hypothetical protein
MHSIISYSRPLRRFFTRLVSPLSNGLQVRRIESLEGGWHHTARARDRVFATRVLQRYAAHYARMPVLPPLPRSQPAGPIPPDLWQTLPRPRPALDPAPEVDVILPITGEYSTVLGAIYRILACENVTRIRLVLLLSAHSDYKLVDKLRRLQELDLFDLLQDEEKRGMIALLNFALQRNETRDVVLLADHVQVVDGWLDRLHAEALEDATTASASPWCLSGGVAGYPDQAGSLSQVPMDLSALNAIAGFTFRETPHVALQTASASASYLTREAIRTVGLLQENTHSLSHALQHWATRAQEKGFGHIVAPTLVLGSFGVSARPNDARDEAALQPLRAMLDRARLDAAIKQTKLVIDGIPAFSDLLGNGAPPHLLLSPDLEDPSMLELGAPDARLTPHLRLPIDQALQPLSELCRARAITHIELRQLAGFPARMLEFTMALAELAQLPLHIHVSDDYLICPGLLGADKECGARDLESGYQSFLDKHPLDADGIPLWLWRMRSAQCLSHAARITFETEALKQLYVRYFRIG